MNVHICVKISMEKITSFFFLNLDLVQHTSAQLNKSDISSPDFFQLNNNDYIIH